MIAANEAAGHSLVLRQVLAGARGEGLGRCRLVGVTAGADACC